MSERGEGERGREEGREMNSHGKMVCPSRDRWKGWREQVINLGITVVIAEKKRKGESVCEREREREKWVVMTVGQDNRFAAPSNINMYTYCCTIRLWFPLCCVKNNPPSVVFL